jgi:large subunit ribosomal protein L3
MTSVISDDGVSTAVTLLSVAPNIVAGLKTEEKDGYRAVQIGFEETKKANKAQATQFKGLGIMPKIIREFRLNESDEEIKIGDRRSADLFSVGDSVDASGVTKGKGFAGTIKRHNFKRGRKTHGGRSYRRPGSIGSMYPQRIFKGKKMAGRMGHDSVTVKRLRIALVDPELNVIGVKGAVPGPRRGVVLLKEAK